MRPEYRTFTATSLADTLAFGLRLGTCLKPGDILTLTGDLGSGKTVLCQGIARGAGVPEACYVTSPTYAIVHEYPGRCPVFHVDLYRLSGPDDLEAIGFEEILEAGGILLIEWPERVPESYLSPAADIAITRRPDDSRSFFISNYGLDLQNLVNFLVLTSD